MVTFQAMLKTHKGNKQHVLKQCIVSSQQQPTKCPVLKQLKEQNIQPQLCKIQNRATYGQHGLWLDLHWQAAGIAVQSSV